MTNMDGNIFAIVCGSITFADFFFNVFFILCLVLTRREPGVNQQHLLRFLLSLVIFTSLFYQMNKFLTVVLEAFEKSAIRSLAMTYFAFLLFMANYSCSSWISVFYYFKIVQRNTAMFTWVKTNIDKVTYCGLVIDCTFLLSGWISAIFDKLSSLGLVYPDVSMVHHNSTLPQARHTAKSYLFFLSRILLLTYYVRPLSCMVWCSSRTYIYLQKHMKSIVDNSSSFSQPQLEAQMRVVVTCMVQAVIFLLGSVFSIVVISIYDHPEYLKRDPEGYSHSGIAIFIMFSNSLCLGFSQSVFRHRVIAFFKKVVKWIYIRR